MCRRNLALLIGLAASHLCRSQTTNQLLSQVDDSLESETVFEKSLSCIGRRNCKIFLVIFEPKLKPVFNEQIELNPPKFISSTPAAKSWKFHGDITYTFDYRTFGENPFKQTELHQHFLRMNVQIETPNGTPIRLSFMNRQSNSPFFRDFIDMGLGFDRGHYFEQLKGKLRAAVETRLSSIANDSVLKKFHRLSNEITALKQTVENTDRAQLEVERRELALLKKLKSSDQYLQAPSGANIQKIRFPSGRVEESIQGSAQFLQDTIDGITRVVSFDESQMERIEQSIASRDKKCKSDKARLDSLNVIYDSLSQSLANLSKMGHEKAKLLLARINRAKTSNDIRELLKENSFDSNIVTKRDLLLTSVKRLQLGRGVVDYSDLTIRNLLLSGLITELDRGSWTFGFVAGRVNHQFRDFLVETDKQRNRQRLVAGKAFYATKYGATVGFTYFNGIREDYLIGVQGQKQGVIYGFALEGGLLVGKQQHIQVEFAKSSSFRTLGATRTNGQNRLSLSDPNNMAFRLEYTGKLTRKAIDVTGYYRRIGSDFQSFNMQPAGTQQESWRVDLKHQLLKRRLGINLGARKNDFSNQRVNAFISSKSILYSALFTYRHPRYPFIVFGVYPATQTSIISGVGMAEQQFNTIFISSGFSKAVRNGLHIQYSLNYNRTAMRQRDSSQVNIPTSNLSSSIMLGNRQIKGRVDCALITQTTLQVFQLDPSVEWTLRSWLKVNAGVRYVTSSNNYNFWGGIGAIQVQLKGLGTIQGRFDQSWLPVFNSQQMKSIEIGQISYFKTF